MAGSSTDDAAMAGHEAALEVMVQVQAGGDDKHWQLVRDMQEDVVKNLESWPALQYLAASDFADIEIQKAAMDGNLLANQIITGEQEGGGRGRSLGVPLDWCDNEAWKQEFSQIEAKQAQVVRDHTAKKFTTEEKDEKLSALKTRRAELIELIQQNVNLKCQRERGQTFAELKKLAALQAKDVKKAGELLQKVGERNAHMAEKIEEQVSLESASSQVEVNAAVLAAERSRKQKERADAQTERLAKKQKKEEEEKEKNPQAFETKRAAAAEAAAAKVAEQEEKKVQMQKAAAEKAADKAKVKMEEAIEKARDPIAFAKKKAAEKVVAKGLGAKENEENEAEEIKVGDQLKITEDIMTTLGAIHAGRVIEITALPDGPQKSYKVAFVGGDGRTFNIGRTEFKDQIEKSLKKMALRQPCRWR